MEIKIKNDGSLDLPDTIKNSFGLKQGDALSIQITENGIILTPKHKKQSETSKQSIVVLSGTPEGKPKYFTIS
jgi:bifunctional DNA-binding transcriptional regulator/antitoxin component of YhaV-PrlF toxin-antitoxin module